MPREEKCLRFVRSNALCPQAGERNRRDEIRRVRSPQRERAVSELMRLRYVAGKLRVAVISNRLFGQSLQPNSPWAYVLTSRDMPRDFARRITFGVVSL
jgi:hypothetical protein